MSEAISEKLKALSKNTLVEHLGIEVTELSESVVKAKMPVDHRHVQPMRLLHGGLNAVLIETLGSIGSFNIVKGEQSTLGLEVNVNHLGAVPEGNEVECIATLVHRGKSTHVWQGDVFFGEKKVATGRLTVMIK